MKDPYNIKVGERIRSSRKARKMTMKELGEKVKLHESTISRYENGDISSLDLEKMKEFASVLCVPVDYLACWDDDVPPKDRSPDIDKALLKWYEAVGELNFNDEEFDELVNYAKYIVSKRGK